MPAGPRIQTVGVEIQNCREKGQPLGTGVFGQFSLPGNHVAALHLETHVFLAGKTYLFSDEQQLRIKIKEEIRAQEKRQ